MLPYRFSCCFGFDNYKRVGVKEPGSSQCSITLEKPESGKISSSVVCRKLSVAELLLGIHWYTPEEL